VTTSAVRVTPISGMGGKSPACFLVEIDHARFLLDLGEGPSPGLFPDLSDVGPVDAILISHGHADHIGGLHLADLVGNPPIYATAMTRAFAGHQALAGALDLPLQGRIEIAGIAVETGRAGHAAGGVWMRLGGEAGVLYTGDLCRESLLYPLDTPLRAHTLIADASYGAYDDALALEALIDHARNTPLLLPLPPTGRGVEIAVLCAEAGLPVAICDQHRHIAALMIAAADGTLIPEGRERLATMLAHAKKLDADDEAHGVMIAANGGATGGLSKKLFERFLPDLSVDILLTGHFESDTPAGEAIAKGRASIQRWNVHPRRRDIAWLHQAVKPQSTLYAFCAPNAAAALDLLV
jgi:Cft2 family RNA processing exonuclease